MNRSESVFIEIFKFYEVHLSEEKEKQTMRKFIRYNLRKEFPDVDWSDTDNWYKLPITERVRFMCDNKTIREYFSKRSRLTESSLKKKIKKVKEENHIEERTKIRNHNARVKHNESLDAYLSKETTPEKDKRLAAYDRALGELPYKKGASLAVEEVEIDHIALRALIKFLENEFSIEVDLDAISRCLIYKREWLKNKDAVLKEDAANIRMAEAQKKLEELDFVKKI